MTFTTTLESAEPPVTRTVGGGKTSGRVYVPKAWIGRDVTVILTTEGVDSNDRS